MNPLENALNEYIGKDLSRFHMPGHKGAESFPEYFKFDITEVEGADSLFESSEAIFETEKCFAKIYGTGASLLSAGGSTLCIQAMLATALNPGDKLIIARNCHASAVNTVALLDLEDPSKVIAEPAGYFMVPEGWEYIGDVMNVLFTNGWIADEDGKVFIYYASSDTRLHVASTTIEKLMDYTFNTPSDALRSADCVKQRCELISNNLKYMGK